MTSPRISIIGSALSGNKGAAAMLESSIQTLGERLNDPQFTLFSVYPNEDAAQNHYPNLDLVPADPITLGVKINSAALAYRLLPPARGWLKRTFPAIKALAESSVLLDQGGITFTDGREKFLIYNVATILPALFVGTPVFKCAQAIGPFTNPVNRALSKLFLPRMHTIVTRGRITHDYAVGLGLKNLFAGADYAFSLEMDGSEAEEVAKHVDLSFFDGGGVVGVCPSIVLAKLVDANGGLSDGRDYSTLVVDFVQALQARGTKVLLLPHSVRTGTEKTHNNDLPMVRDIAARLDQENLLFIDTELSSQQLRYLIGRCDLFVASRFHAMVSSLAMAVPTIVIGWSHKYREVLEMFGAEHWAFGHDQLSLDYLNERFTELSEHRDEVKALLEEKLPAVKATSREQADLIAELVTRS